MMVIEVAVAVNSALCLVYSIDSIYELGLVLLPNSFAPRRADSN